MITAEEYLHTSFTGIDCEYRDGEIVERALPDYPHGRTQGLMGNRFAACRKEHLAYPCHSPRMKLRDGLYLVPDVAVFWPLKPRLIPDSPPLIAVEILSPDDRFMAVREKLQEYHDWGVTHVWLADPYSQRLYTCDMRLKEVKSFVVPELGIEVMPEQIFD